MAYPKGIEGRLVMDQRFIDDKAGDKISSGPQVGRLATSPLPSGVPDASRRGTKSEKADKWADWRHNPCRFGGPQRITIGDKVKSGQQVGRLAT